MGEASSLFTLPSLFTTKPNQLTERKINRKLATEYVGNCRSLNNSLATRIAVTAASPVRINYLTAITSPSTAKTTSHFLQPLRCVPLDQAAKAEVVGEAMTIMCEPCNGKGWLLCDFCKGQKTNVKGDNRRVYRRCPSCRAVGYVLCSSCKVFKCVTFPDFVDGNELSF